MKVNNKGFSIIEIVFSFVLIGTICIMLFQLIYYLRNIYKDSDIKTSLLSRQAILTDKLATDLNNQLNRVTMIKTCTDDEAKLAGRKILNTSCLALNFSDGSIKYLALDPIEKQLVYDNYLIKYDNISNQISFGNLVLDQENSDNFFWIKIPVYYKDSKINYGVKILVTYNTSISLNYEPSVITIDKKEHQITKTDNKYYIPIDYNNLSDEWKNKQIVFKMQQCGTNRGYQYHIKYDTGIYDFCETNNLYATNSSNALDLDNSNSLESLRLTKNYVTEINDFISSNNINNTSIYLDITEFVNQYRFKADSLTTES